MRRSAPGGIAGRPTQDDDPLVPVSHETLRAREAAREHLLDPGAAGSREQVVPLLLGRRGGAPAPERGHGARCYGVRSPETAPTNACTSTLTIQITIVAPT